MKVLFYGHSYVRDLHRKCNWAEPLVVAGQQVHVDYLFRYFPGKDYDFVVNRPQEAETLKSINPDYIIVILGGNSIVESRTNGEINELAANFYANLKKCLPHTVVITAQIEPRYYSEANRFGAPPAAEYNRRRVILNNYLNQKLKKRGLIDFMALLGSAAVYNEAAFTDGVHLRHQPLLEYQQVMLNTLVYAAERQ